MDLKEIIDIYESKDAVPRFFINKDIVGGILTIPKNIILNCQARELIYDIEANSFSVYENKHKLKTVNCEYPFATMSLAIIDMVVTTSNQGYSFELCRVLDENNNCINNEEIMLDVFNAIPKKSTKKEKSLVSAVSTSLESNGVDSVEIDKSILDAYNYVLDYYQENLNV